MTNYKKILILLALILVLGIFCCSHIKETGILINGNTLNPSFAQAKKWLENDVYYDHRTTFYCQAEFNAEKLVRLPKGFKAEKYTARSNRVEWEHIVPAEHLGRNFSEWKLGHPDCINEKGRPFKGRKCAEQTNPKYQFMQADMYNLVPAIGSVNATRQNYIFTQFHEDIDSSFGSCLMKIKDKKASPPPYARGFIGRTYLYIKDSYPEFQLENDQITLMENWDKAYPVDSWECERSCRIQRIQKNTNNIVKDRCIKKGLWKC